jgi:hypothetical protein
VYCGSRTHSSTCSTNGVARTRWQRALGPCCCGDPPRPARDCRDWPSRDLATDAIATDTTNTLCGSCHSAINQRRCGSSRQHWALLQVAYRARAVTRSTAPAAITPVHDRARARPTTCFVSVSPAFIRAARVRATSCAPRKRHRLASAAGPGPGCGVCRRSAAGLRVACKQRQLLGAFVWGSGLGLTPAGSRRTTSSTFVYTATNAFRVVQSCIVQQY